MIKVWAHKREGYIVLMTVAIWLLITGINSNFANPLFLLDLTGYNSVYFICALGILPLMIMGGIDLSVSGIILSVSMVLTLVMNQMSVSLPILLLIAIVAGVGFGLFNGLLIAKLKVSSVIVTLATMSIYRGTTKYWFQQNKAMIGTSEFVHNLKISFLGLSIQNWMIIVMALLTYYLLHYHRTGRSVYAIGGNRDLAKLKGFNIFGTTLTVYGYSGLAAGLAAVMHILLLGQANIEAYSSLDFDIIIIVIIGGLNIIGGYGTVLGTLFATMFMVILQSGLVFARIPAFWHNLLIGFIIIAVVSYDMIVHKIKLRKLISQWEGME
jgi:simple sugar transport system permease protein/ribose transport system permease protein